MLEDYILFPLKNQADGFAGSGLPYGLPPDRYILADPFLGERMLAKVEGGHESYRGRDITDPTSEGYQQLDAAIGQGLVTGEQFLSVLGGEMQLGGRTYFTVPTTAMIGMANLGPGGLGVYNNPNIAIGTEKGSVFQTPAETSPEMLAAMLVKRAGETRVALEQAGEMFNPEDPFSIILVGDGNGRTLAAADPLVAVDPVLSRNSRFVCVDAGNASLEKQKQVPTETPTVYHRRSVLNMEGIPPTRGIAYLFEVLDDLPANVMRRKTPGQTSRYFYAWEGQEPTGDAQLLEVITRSQPPSGRIPAWREDPYEFAYDYFGYGRLAHDKPLPVSMQSMMAVRELDRVLQRGTALLVDYTGPFGQGDFVSEQPVRMVGPAETVSADTLGFFNLTTDVDPVVVDWMFQRLGGWERQYLGSLYAHLAGDDEGKKQIKQTLWGELMLYYYQMQILEDTHAQDIIRYRQEEEQGISAQRPGWYDKYKELAMRAKQLQIYDPQYWAMDYTKMP